MAKAVIIKNQTPQNWQKAKINDVCYPVSETFDFSKHKKFIFINTGDIEEGKFLHRNYFQNSHLPGQAKKVIKNADILYSEIRPKNKHFAFIDFNADEYVVSTKLMVIRNKVNILPEFLYLLLTHKIVVKNFQTIAEGRSGTFPQLTFDAIASYIINLPTKEEQRRILNSLNSVINKIEVNNKIAKTLEEMAQTLFKEWFIKFKFPGHEKVEFVDSELGKIPNNWIAQPFGKVSTNYDRKRKPLSNMERVDIKGNYPYYGATEIMDHINEYIFDGEYLLVAEDGTVETDEGKAVLQFIEGKFWVNNHAHIIQGTTEAPTFYLYLIFRNTSIKPYITGAVQLKLTQENLNKIPVITPPVDIMGNFTSIVYPMILKIRKYHEENQKLAALRDLLLPKLMKGEIRV